jgi:hypothetical protein
MAHCQPRLLVCRVCNRQVPRVKPYKTRGRHQSTGRPYIAAQRGRSPASHLHWLLNPGSASCVPRTDGSPCALSSAGCPSDSVGDRVGQHAGRDWAHRRLLLPCQKIDCACRTARDTHNHRDSASSPPPEPQQGPAQTSHPSTSQPLTHQPHGSTCCKVCLRLSFYAGTSCPGGSVK